MIGSGFTSTNFLESSLLDDRPHAAEDVGGAPDPEPAADLPSGTGESAGDAQDPVVAEELGEPVHEG